MASRHHLTHPGGVLPVVSSKWVSFVGQILLQRIRDLAGFDLSVVVFVPLITTHPKIKKDTADGSSGQITLFFKTHRQKKNGNANKSETILKQRINVKNPPPPLKNIHLSINSPRTTNCWRWRQRHYFEPICLDQVWSSIILPHR